MKSSKACGGDIATVEGAEIERKLCISSGFAQNRQDNISTIQLLMLLPVLAKNIKGERHMPLLIIIAIVVLFFFWKKKSAGGKADSATVSLDTNSMPDSLTELRKKRDRLGIPKNYPYQVKICELGVQMFREGKLEIAPGCENDVSTLLEEIVELNGQSAPDDSDTSQQEQMLWEAAVEITEHFVNETIQHPELKNQFNYPAEDILFHGYSAVATGYAEGKWHPRDAERSRSFWRKYLVAVKDISDTRLADGIYGLMEVPPLGDPELKEIVDWAGELYCMQYAKFASGEYKLFHSAPGLVQCAELLYLMDKDVIGSNDISAVLREYEYWASKDNAYALYKLGCFHLDGTYGMNDAEKGVALLERAGELGLYIAADRLGDHFYWLANADDSSATQQQIQEYKEKNEYWFNRSSQLGAEVSKKYMKVFGVK